MRATILVTILAFGTQAGAHSGGLDKQGCHAGSKPYHCHKAQKSLLHVAATRAKRVVRVSWTGNSTEFLKDAKTGCL